MALFKTVEVGDVVGGRFEILGALGSGYFSTIYGALDRFGKAQSHFAVKIACRADFNFVLAQEKENLQLLSAEDPTGAHHFVCLQQTFLWEGRLCLAMELLGPSLRYLTEVSLQMEKAITLCWRKDDPVASPNFSFFPSSSRSSSSSSASSSSLPPSFPAPNIADLSKRLEVVRPKISHLRSVAFQLFTALVYFEKRGLIHADLKPENILLISNPGEKAIWGNLSDVSIKVVDFGNSFPAAKAELYFNDFELQTPSHRAPEVLFGIPFSFKIDVWSVACVLLNLLTLQHTFSLPEEEISDRSPISRRRVLLQSFAKTLGPVPSRAFQQGMYTGELSRVSPQCFTAETNHLNSRKYLLEYLRPYLPSPDPVFIDFMCGLFCYNPKERFSATEALSHPFMHPCLPPIFSHCLSQYMRGPRKSRIVPREPAPQAKTSTFEHAKHFSEILAEAYDQFPESFLGPSPTPKQETKTEGGGGGEKFTKAGTKRKRKEEKEVKDESGQQQQNNNNKTTQQQSTTTSKRNNKSTINKSTTKQQQQPQQQDKDKDKEKEKRFVFSFEPPQRSSKKM